MLDIVKFEDLHIISFSPSGEKLFIRVESIRLLAESGAERALLILKDGSLLQTRSRYKDLLGDLKEIQQDYLSGNTQEISRATLFLDSKEDLLARDKARLALPADSSILH